MISGYLLLSEQVEYGIKRIEASYDLLQQVYEAVCLAWSIVESEGQTCASSG